MKRLQRRYIRAARTPASAVPQGKRSAGQATPDSRTLASQHVTNGTPIRPVRQRSASGSAVRAEIVTPAELLGKAGGVPATWTGDTAVWVQIEETLACLPSSRKGGGLGDAPGRGLVGAKVIRPLKRLSPPLDPAMPARAHPVVVIAARLETVAIEVHADRRTAAPRTERARRPTVHARGKQPSLRKDIGDMNAL